MTKISTLCRSFFAFFGLACDALLGVFHSLDTHRGYGVSHGSHFQHGNGLLLIVMFTVNVAPCVTPFRLWMACEIGNFNPALPDCLAIKHFMHWHCLTVNCTAVVQMLNCYL